MFEIQVIGNTHNFIEIEEYPPISDFVVKPYIEDGVVVGYFATPVTAEEEDQE